MGDHAGSSPADRTTTKAAAINRAAFILTYQKSIVMTKHNSEF